jgi:hypothetical protein
MTIETTDKLIAQLHARQREHVADLPPAEKRRLIEALEQALSVARSVAGVLAELKSGRQS